MSSNFSPTPAELALVSQIFAQGDPQKLGVLTGDVAVRLFGGAKLDANVLGEIWSIADEDNKGWLPKKGVAIAVRLMGWAQRGEKVTLALLAKPGPLPTIEGITAIKQQPTGSSLSKTPTQAGVPPPLTPQDKAKFQNMFLKAGPVNGLLSGEKARDIFVRSKLSNEKLLQIWNLADTQDRGALDSADFVIGMYLIQATMSGQLPFIPTNLPPGLYQQAGGFVASSVTSIRSHTSGSSGSFSPQSSTFAPNRTIPLQYTGQPIHPNNTGSTARSQPPHLPARPATSSAFSSSPFANIAPTPLPWDITPTEKAAADKYFDDLDKTNRGFIEGDVAVPFMLESKLPGEDLAQVWDLADINNDGRLTRDGFAVALYLIQKKLAGGEIPTTLPPSLIPPSMRPRATPVPFVQPPPPEPAGDLFSWDEAPVTPSQSISSPFSQRSSTSTHSPSDPQTASKLSSPFGASTSMSQNFFDEDEEQEAKAPIHDHSVEIGNLQNQLSSTNKSLATTRNERATLESTAADQANQLSALQTQLSSAKASYSTEVQLLANLKDRYANQASEIQTIKAELIRAESDLSALRVEKSEIEGSFLRDKEDARDLHKKMVEVGQLVETLKVEIEKAKKDAKQQKGLLAIAKKQLSTKEAEKVRVEKDLEQAQTEARAIFAEREQTEDELASLAYTAPIPERTLSTDSVTFAANHALPNSPDIPTSGVTSPGKSNNPFDRLTKTSGQSTPRSQSPFLPFVSPTVVSNAEESSLHAAAALDTDDIFGFSDAFADNTERTRATSPGATFNAPDDMRGTSPSNDSIRSQAIQDIFATSNIPSSPNASTDNEHFSTPPSTQSQNTSPVLPQAARTNTVDNFVAHFPAIGEIPAPTHQQETSTETDLSASLTELEAHEESDTDSDSDTEDEVPLAELQQKGKGTEAISPSKTTETQATEKVSLDFDEVFGLAAQSTPETKVVESAVVTPQPQETPELSKALDAPTLPSVSTTQSLASSSTAGVNAFDEAMGKIPSAAPTTANFTFESAFEDDFDFASAAESMPLPITSTLQNGHSTEATSKPDDLFTLPLFPLPSKNGIASPVTGTAAKEDQAAKPVVPTSQSELNGQSTTLGPSFDDVFSGFETPSAVTITSDNATPVTSSVPTSPNVSVTESNKSPFPQVQVQPPRDSPSPPKHRAKSPPPPRASSPKPPRPSTSSSKEQDKVKEVSPRHSKLSIRLPFRKKKHSEPLPSSPSYLPPPQEEVPGRVTPAVDDDVEAVKQLTAMGFSRSQAVTALEKYAYDVQKALNSLLGAQ